LISVNTLELVFLQLRGLLTLLVLMVLFAWCG